MNYSIDLLTSFADKLTIRLMQLANVKQESIDKVLKAFIDKQNGIVDADKQLDVPITILGITFKNLRSAIFTVAVIIGLFLLYKVYRSNNRR